MEFFSEAKKISQNADPGNLVLTASVYDNSSSEGVKKEYFNVFSKALHDSSSAYPELWAITENRNRLCVKNFGGGFSCVQYISGVPKYVLKKTVLKNDLKSSHSKKKVCVSLQESPRNVPPILSTTNDVSYVEKTCYSYKNTVQYILETIQRSNSSGNLVLYFIKIKSSLDDINKFIPKLQDLFGRFRGTDEIHHSLTLVN